MFVHAVSVAVLICSCALPHTAAYGQNSAVIMVNGNSQGIPAGMVNSNNANGSNVAEAAVFNGAAVAGFDNQVNSMAASASEKTALAALAAAARANGSLRSNMINVRNPALQAFQNTILTGTAPDAGGAGNFALVPKANIGKSMTMNVQPTNGAGNAIGSAQATANQTINGMKVTFGDSTSAFGLVPGAVGIAFTSHHDPFEVDWTSPGSRSLTVDLSATSFTLSTQGSGNTAVGFLGISASINDNTTNINVPESLATPLFSLTVPVISFDGGPAQVYPGAAALTLTTGTISDNFGNMGMTNVLNGLLGDLSVSSTGTVSFLSPYMITDTLSGTALQSVVYLDQVTFGEAFIAPEPSSIVLLIAGAAGIAGLRWKTQRGAPTASQA